MTYICLLRGVNVGGRAKVPMADFRDLLGGVGATRVRTYVNSGNAVFEHDLPRPEEIASRVADALRERLGVEVGVVVLTAQDLADVARQQPFPHGTAEQIAMLHVGFLFAVPEAGMPASVPAPANVGRDEFVLGEAAVYVRCPDGFGRTKLNGTFFERALGVPVTFRNWRTVLALLEMAAGSAG